MPDLQNPLPNVERHVHNGLDSPKVKEKDLYGAIDKSTVVLLTTAQTIADVKTFTSIPLLPASDPTTDNQGARKKYVDDSLGATETAATDNLRDSADTSRSADSATYEKVKEIKFNADNGTVRVKFDLYVAGTSGTVYGRIYKNGVAHGTEQSTAASAPQNFSEDLAFETDDLIQLYAKNTIDDYVVRNFRLYYDKVFTVTVGTVNQN